VVRKKAIKGQTSGSGTSKARNRWQDDPYFVAWLTDTGYEACSLGLKLYMWEAWTEGAKTEREDAASRE